jgi:hypothetical protein
MRAAEQLVTKLLETEGSDFVKDEIERLEIGHRIVISFSKYKFDDDGSGNYEDEHGWEDELGVDMEPDEFDTEAGTTAVSKAINFLLEEGAVEPSNSHFYIGTWYATASSDPDSEGWHTERHFHLKGFTDEEQEQVFNAIRPPRR